jgi:hypothetical protein
VIIVFLGPYLWTFGWHLTHSKTVNLSGYQITIPDNFFKVSGESGIQLLHVRAVFSYPRFWELSMITIAKKPGTADINKLDWESMGNEYRKEGKNVNTFKVNLAGTEGECMRIVPKNIQEDPVSTSCLNSNGLLIGYEGDGSDEDEYRLFMLNDLEISK